MTNVKCFWRILVILTAFLARLNALRMHEGAYEDLVVEIADNVPTENCLTLLHKLEETLSETSHLLFQSLQGRAFLRSASVILPKTWPSSCSPRAITRFRGQNSDVTVTRDGPGKTWTLQPSGCGQGGHQIYMPRKSLLQTNDSSLPHHLLQQFAKYRYGVFDERGFERDPIYPLCQQANPETPTGYNASVTGCSNRPLTPHPQVCNGEKPLEGSLSSEAVTSVMFSTGVGDFCDGITHDRNTPTKHNYMCRRESTLEVILRHGDFVGGSNATVNRTLRVSYERRGPTRFVLAVEDTKQMSLRESWSFLRTAVRKWAVNDLPSTSEVSVVIANDSSAITLFPLTLLDSADVRTLVSSNLPYSPSDSTSPGCLQCALKQALQELKRARVTRGASSEVIVLIAPGSDRIEPMVELAQEAKLLGIRVVTINYPGLLRNFPLDEISDITEAQGYTIVERKHNIDTSLLTTYFDLSNVLRDVSARYNDGDPRVEVYRRRVIDDGRGDGPKTIINGAFVLDPGLGEPATFALYAHNMDAPLVYGLTLTSPSGSVYRSRSDSLVSVKIITLPAPLNETGTWTYRMERYPGNPQPHFVQVTATPQSVQVINAKLWVDRSYLKTRGVIGVYALLTQGVDTPVISAHVLLTVNALAPDGTTQSREQFPLLDSGAGDPDTIRGDGVYSRYFAPTHAGTYTFDVTATDNGNTAYGRHPGSVNHLKTCCGGSVMTPEKARPLPSFQRVLPTVSLVVSDEEMTRVRSLGGSITVGRVGDLRTQYEPGHTRARLVWTAPDTAGRRITRYEIKYAKTIDGIVDSFDGDATQWEDLNPLPLAAGSEMTATLDYTQKPQLFDQTLYYALRIVVQDTVNGEVSNFARLHVVRPAPAPSTSRDTPTWPSPVVPTSWIHSSNPNSAPTSNRGTGPELRLTLIAVGVLLAALLAVLCVCCVVRRRGNRAAEHKTVVDTHRPKKTVESPPQTAVSVISTAGMEDVGPQDEEDQLNEEEDLKKRYSIVHQQEMQMADELRMHQQRMQQFMQQNEMGTVCRRQRALSPYESWSASQLLHEHERRHSPVDDMSSHYGTALQPNMLLPGILPPPVPPLPSYDGYPAPPPGYVSYGVLSQPPQLMDVSLRGSASSVGSGDRRRRNVTMV